MYRRFGLSDRQIDIVADATPKRHYYYVSPLGRRLFQFSLGPAALAFIGAGSKDDVLSARRMIEQHGDRWTVEWLRTRGLPDWAEYLDKLYRQCRPAHRSDASERTGIRSIPTGSSIKGRYINESQKTLSAIPRDRGRD